MLSKKRGKEELKEIQESFDKIILSRKKSKYLNKYNSNSNFLSIQFYVINTFK